METFMVRKLKDVFNDLNDVRNDFLKLTLNGFLNNKNFIKEFKHKGVFFNQWYELKDDCLKIYYSLPGVEKNDIELFYDVADGVLKIELKLKKSDSSDNGFDVNETSVYINHLNLDLDDVTASYNNGLLVVEFKKSENKTKRKLEIS